MMSKMFLFSLSVFLSVALVQNEHHISKRYLLYPRAAVAQFSTGLTVPLVLPRRSINFSILAQTNYNLPYNVTNFHPMTISARDKEKTSSFDITRSKFYEYIIAFLDSFGLEGKECMLRSICEISEFPMHIKEEETLLEKIVHYVFTPSLESTDYYTNETIADDRRFHEKLLLAEKIGRENGDCSDIYSDCILSLVDLFTAKYMI